MQDPDVKRRVRPRVDVRDELVRARERLAIDGLDLIAGLQACLRGGRVGFDALDDIGRSERYAHRPCDAGRDADREQQVEDRTRDDDDEALPQRMMLEIAGVSAAVVGLILADHLAIAAQRQGVDAIRRVPARPFRDRRPEADREIAHAHAETLREDEVAELVEDDEDAQHEQEQGHLADRRKTGDRDEGDDGVYPLYMERSSLLDRLSGRIYSTDILARQLPRPQVGRAYVFKRCRPACVVL